MPKTKVIIDTDPGIDDFFALILAASSDRLDIRGVTAVAGNQVMERVTANALGIACLLGIGAPVSRGASRPLLFPQVTASVVHGETGLGGFPLPTSNRALDSRPAWRLIYDEALAAGEELEIIAIGPMTNIAIALLRYPELAGMIRRIVSMGGSTEWGNRGAYGEFNYYVDPHAAQIVFQSGIPVHMVGLNVTMKTGMSEAEINSLYAAVAQKEYEELLDFYRQVYAENDLGFQVVAIHDALAVAYAIDPSVLHMEKAHVEVDTSSGPCRGRTVLSHGSPSHSLAATAVNKPQFLTMMRDALARIHDIRV